MPGADSEAVRQAAAHLAGELTLVEARERTVIATRQFARRQLGWWRKDPRIVWVAYDADDRVEQALAAVRAVGTPVTTDR